MKPKSNTHQGIKKALSSKVSKLKGAIQLPDVFDYKKSLVKALGLGNIAPADVIPLECK